MFVSFTLDVILALYRKEASFGLPEEDELPLGRRGVPPPPLLGDYPGRLGGAGYPPPEPRGPGARGWCKRDPRGVRKSQKPRFWPKKPENAQIWVFTRIFGLFDWNRFDFENPKSKRISVKIRLLDPFEVRTPGRPRKWGFWDFGVPRGSLLHQPLAPGPRGSRRGVSGKEGFSDPLRGPGLAARDGVAGSGPGPRGPGSYGVPSARGWCKTPAETGVPDPDPGILEVGETGSLPPGGGPPPGDWGPGPSWTRRSRDPGVREVPDPGDRAPGSRKGLPRPRGRAPEGLFYINPSRRGPAVPGGDREVPGPPPRRPGAKGA